MYRDGRAITLVNPDDIRYFKDIERFLDKTIDKVAVPEELGETPEYKTANRSAKKTRRDNRNKNAHRRKPNKNKEVRDEKREYKSNGNHNPEKSETKPNNSHKGEPREAKNNNNRNGNPNKSRNNRRRRRNVETVRVISAGADNFKNFHAGIDFVGVFSHRGGATGNFVGRFGFRALG